MAQREYPKQHSERLLWIVVTSVLLTCVVLLVFSPRVLAGNEDAEAERLLVLFGDVFDYVRENYVDEDKVSPQNLMEGALTGLFEALDDPHSAYLTQDEMRSIQDTTTGEFGGVGLIISKVERGVEIIAPIEDTPAYAAGISAGDIIIQINDESSVEMDIDDVVSRLRGSPGTEVRITLQRGESGTFTVTIERAMIEVPTVKRAMIPESVGYLRITTFTPLTLQKVEEAIEYFKQNAYTSLVIDLRNNPGGLLPVVVDVADLLISSGPIVSTKSRVPAENSIYYASEGATMVDHTIPVVVLVDKGSASASEILAGALQDSKRATLVGQQTYGKGSVQQIRHIMTGGFRMTMSRYYTPSGKSIDKVGIEPDVAVETAELTEDEKRAATALMEGGNIKSFVAEHPNPSESDIDNFENALAESGLTMDKRYLRKLIRNEVNRTNNNPPVYDLEYDTVLKRALELISTD